MTRNSVVPETSGVTEAEFHAAMVTGLARAAKRLGGEAALAYVMGITEKQLSNIRKGAATHPKRLFDALMACPSALDDVAKRYGYRLVPRSGIRASVGEDLNVAMSRVSQWLDESMHSQSELGPDISRDELIRGETQLRELQHRVNDMIAAIDDAKAHRLRAVPGHGRRQA